MASSGISPCVAVLDKIGCIFEYERDSLTGRPTGRALESLAFVPTSEAIVTAKLDGTCCLIRDGQMHARQDVKGDLSRAPKGWFPTGSATDGVPDAGGHLIGFRPLNGNDKWHNAALRSDNCALFLAYKESSPDGCERALPRFTFVVRPLSEFNGRTLELLGPKIDSNRHNLSEHAYAVHGSIPATGCTQWQTHAGLRSWLESPLGSLYEGIVIHDAGRMFKCHRGHLGLKWEGGCLDVEM